MLGTPAGKADYLERIFSQSRTAAATLVLRYGLAFAFNIIGSVIIARIMGPRFWGIYAVSYFIYTSYAFLSLGVWGYLIQQQHEPDPLMVRVGFLSQYVISLTWSALISLAIAPWLQSRFPGPELTPMVVGAIIGGCFASWRWLAVSLAERRLDYRTVAIVEVLEVAVFNVVATLAVVSGAAIVGVMVANIARGLVPAVYALTILRLSPLPGWNWNVFRQTWRFGSKFLGLTVLQWLPVNAGPIAAGIVIGAEGLGYLQLAYRVLEYPRVLVTMMFRIFMSVFSRLQEDRDAFIIAAQSAMTLVVELAVPSIVIIASLSGWWLPQVFGRAWSSVPGVLMVLALPFVLSSVMIVLATALSASGRVEHALRPQLVMHTLFWPLVYLLSRKLGLFGLPIAEWTVLVGLTVLFSRLRAAGVNIATGALAVRVIIATAVGVLVWMLIRGGYWPIAILLAALFAAVWVWQSTSLRRLLHARTAIVSSLLGRS